MRSEISFTIPGVPVPWSRAGGGKTTKHFTPAKQRSYMDAVRLYGKVAMKGKELLKGPLCVDLVAVFPSTVKNPSGWKTTKADIDNIYKINADALNNIVWEDDAQICDVHMYKIYGPHPGVTITVFELDQSNARAE